MMAGIVFTTDGRDWSNRSSVFYWLMETMADHSHNAVLSERLREVSALNLGILNLADLTSAELEEFVSVARRAPQLAREELPDTPYRDAVVEHIVEFSDIVTADHRGTGSDDLDPPVAAN